MNTILNSSIIAKELMMAFKNNLGLGDGIDMQYKDEFARTGAKAGSTVNVKKPIRFMVRTGQALDLQDVLDEVSPLTIAYQDHVDFQFSSADLVLSIDAFSERYLTPAAAALASKFDTRVAGLYDQVANYVGVPGAVPTASLTYSAARTALNIAGAPDEGKRKMVVNSNMMANAVDAMKGLFHPSDNISDQLKKGRVYKKVLGFDWVEDDNLIAHTYGLNTGAPLVNGANQTGSSIICDAWVSLGTVKKGDIFQFTGVFSVNPLTYLSTGVLANFTATADTAVSTNDMTIPISPPLITSGPNQNVTGSPADNAPVLMAGVAATYSQKVSTQGLAFHPKAFTAAFVDLPVWGGQDICKRMSDPELGLSMRVWRQPDIQNDQCPTRVDILYGLACLRPEFACRVQSA